MRHIVRLILAVSLIAAVFIVWLLRRPETTTVNQVQVAWVLELPQRGAVISSPFVDGDHVYFGAIEDRGLSTAGCVYCVNRHTGKIIWRFDNGGEMLHMYSSPCVAHGRVYIGEGMHANYVCRLYCLDAKDGKLHWDFTAKGHVESTPCVSDGRVFFGAGDDGLYCLDAVTGRKQWQFQGPFHIDASPAVHDNRVYAGSGVSQAKRITEAFCLDAKTGGVIWRLPAKLPVWGSPRVEGAQVFFGLGNGRLVNSAEPPEKPAGALLCVDASSGKQAWLFDVPDAVLNRPAADKTTAYFGARDGRCYAVDRSNGQLRWQQDVGSPIVTSPALSEDRLYIVASTGLVQCLRTSNGKKHWSFDVARHTQTKPQMFSSPAVIATAEGRRVFFGAELRGAFHSTGALFCLND